MNSVIISKSFPHAFDQQHFPRKGSRSCTGVPWCSALCCLQGKKQDKTNNRNPTVPTLYLCSNSSKCDKSSRSGVWGEKSRSRECGTSLFERWGRHSMACTSQAHEWPLCHCLVKADKQVYSRLAIQT